VTTLVHPAPPLSSLVFSLMGSDDPVPRMQSLVQAARQGDPSAFAALVRSAQRAVYGLCYRILRSEGDANEMAQEAFLRAYQHLGRYDEDKPFEIWVLAIARNLCLDRLRRTTRFKEEALEPIQDALPSPAASAEDRVIALQEQSALEAALGQLSVQDREVLALYYVQRQTTRDIAKVLGVAPGTIMAKLFRAREKLRRILSEENAP